MITVVTAPNENHSIKTLTDVKLFLAGGITNVEDWQSALLQELQTYLLWITIYNPRRENFPIDDPTESEIQICWEYQHLTDSDIIAFWFAKGSLNPIVLLELGKYGLASKRPIVIGVDPDYERKQDVIIQTALSRPDIEIVDNFNDFIEEIVYTINNFKK
jgi:hypothetical protein